MNAITELPETVEDTVTVAEEDPAGTDGVVSGNVMKFFAASNVSMMGGWTD